MAEYSNRTDLQNPAKKIARAAATGQTYGEAGKQMAAQKVVPMGASPTDTFATPRTRPQPGSLGALDAMTTRPGESLVGAANRPSDAPVVLPMRDPVVDELEVLYQMFPNDDLASLISALKWGGA